jgi:hypothetical protein
MSATVAPAASLTPALTGAKILDNHIAGTNPGCATPDTPFVFGIDGAINALVRHNRIEGQTVGGLPTFSRQEWLCSTKVPPLRPATS